MPTPLDFARVFDIAPNAFMVLDRQLRYVAANAAYLDATGSTLDGLLGRHLFDLFPNDPSDPENAPQRLLRKSLERVLETGREDHLALIPYRVPKKVGDVVVEEDRFWSATHRPLLDGEGRVAFILQHTVDVTELRARERSSPPGDGGALREQTGVFERARAVQKDNERIEAEREQLRVLFEQAPGFMCVLEGRDHVFRLHNAAYAKLVGGRDLLGKKVDDALPEIAGQGFVDLLDRVFTSGEAFVGSNTRILLQQKDGEAADEVFLDFVYQPLRKPNGEVYGIFVQGHDVTETRRAEREREAALRTAQAFSDELLSQSREVMATLDKAKQRIAELEAQLATR